MVVWAHFFLWLRLTTINQEKELEEQLGSKQTITTTTINPKQLLITESISRVSQFMLAQSLFTMTKSNPELKILR